MYNGFVAALEAGSVSGGDDVFQGEPDCPSPDKMNWHPYAMLKEVAENAVVLLQLRMFQDRAQVLCNKCKWNSGVAGSFCTRGS